MVVVGDMVIVRSVVLVLSKRHKVRYTPWHIYTQKDLGFFVLFIYYIGKA